MLSFFGTELFRRVRSHSQASRQAILEMGPDEPGQLMGFFFSPVTIILLQRIRPSSYQFCIRCILIYRLVWSSKRVRTDVISKPKVKVVTQQGWSIPCLMSSDIFSLSYYKIKEIARVRRYPLISECPLMICFTAAHTHPFKIIQQPPLVLSPGQILKQYSAVKTYPNCADMKPTPNSAEIYRHNYITI